MNEKKNDHAMYSAVAYNRETPEPINTKGKECTFRGCQSYPTCQIARSVISDSKSCKVRDVLKSSKLSPIIPNTADASCPLLPR